MRRYYEFFTLVIIISVVAMFLMQRLNTVRDEMEGATLQANAASIRSQLLEVVAHKETFGGRLPDSENPVDWLASPLQNYRGGLDTAPEERSIWYFDRKEKVLVYRFRDGHAARFRLSRDAGRGQDRGVLAGIGLQRLDDRPE